MPRLKGSFIASPYIGLILTVLSMTGRAADPPRSWPPNQFAPVTRERISALPTNEQPAWKAYWETSQALARSLPVRSVPDFSPLKPLDHPLQGALYSKGLQLQAPRAWYASEEARLIADRVVGRQSAAGGWTKGIDYTTTNAASATESHGVWNGGTFDNDATTAELRFLALVNAQAGDTARSASWRDSVLRGLRYVFNSQYPNGGIPQIYPLAGGYHDAVTYNDCAMRRVLEILRDVSAGSPEFAFVSRDFRTEAQRRLERGIDCILATQLRDKDGRRTVWCAQYDALTLEPCAARNFEPIAAVTWESADLVTFLMTLPRPSTGVLRAVDDAVVWFRRTSFKDMIWSRFTNDAQIVVLPGAAPMWARFCELNTEKPIFGDRDRTIHYAVGELSTERRAGYSWYGTWPAVVLESYDAWRKKVQESLP